VTTHRPGAAPLPEEPPQAIADDYPGWEVRFTGGRWTAWCPAVTVNATTAAEIRAAINCTICGDDG
jgi:hypothetical protein